LGTQTARHRSEISADLIAMQALARLRNAQRPFHRQEQKQRNGQHRRAVAG
jgi:hypothetical protein